MTLQIDQHFLLVPSCLSEAGGQWQTATEYRQSRLAISAKGFSAATDVLLAQPNLNSSHLFRADILYDSAERLKTPAEHERDRGLSVCIEELCDDVAKETPERLPGFTLTRTVVRKLIPRNQQLDQTLVQSCHVYEAGDSKHLVVYRPHADSAEATPWYHPPVRTLAYLYEVDSANEQIPVTASISVHVLLFEASPSDSTISTRLHRTLLSLLHTLTRLAKSMSRSGGDTAKAAIAPKDNIIPQHIVQNTYSRLKQTYSADLISRWVEKTEPSKHVFEDLSIAAFLIELWRQMYGVVPACERPASASTGTFPGFVDIACGNGVLVYVLREEGYEGWGLDARRRHTWEVLPGNVQEYLLELVLVPEPYLRAIRPPLPQGDMDTLPLHPTKSFTGLQYHNGIFKAGTFVISNHADELTPWTPILAAMSCPADPLPWLAIPCCSHALSGARYRYPRSKTTSQAKNNTPSGTLKGNAASHPSNSSMARPPKSEQGLNDSRQGRAPAEKSIRDVGKDEQPVTGDLKALRATKAEEARGADHSSMYACLTAKVVCLAEELGIETEKTLMRIPSTRNVGILGGRRRAMQNQCLLVKVRTREEEEEEEEEEKEQNKEEVVVAVVEEVKERPPIEVQNGVGLTESSGEPLALDSGNTTIISDTRREDGLILTSEHTILSKIDWLIERECEASGGVAAAAQTWMERTKSLQAGQGRGKLNAAKPHG